LVERFIARCTACVYRGIDLLPVINQGNNAMSDVQTESWERVIRGGDRVLIRPLHSQDVELERRFIEKLSPASRRFRFLNSMTVPSDELLRQLTELDPATDMAYVAVSALGSQEDPIGIGRFSAADDDQDCEFAVTVADQWQNKGLGTLLMQHLVEGARKLGIDKMHSSDASDNERMRRFAAHLGLQHQPDPDDAMLVLYSLDLNTANAVTDDLR
jgi:GNAT superfamily N-acetyltransferase